MSGLTGLPVSDFLLIALAEFLSLLCFLISQDATYKQRFLAYAGDNQNVATWIKYRKPKNRAAQYFTRILNRFVTENDCTVFPRYVSSGNNVFCDKLSRLDEKSALQHGSAMGYEFRECVTMFKLFLSGRLRTRSLVLPTDPPDRVQRIMQFVEKRIIRSIPQKVKDDCSMVLLGLGSTHWRQVVQASIAENFQKPQEVPWPSENAGCQTGGLCSHSLVDCLVFSAPENVRDSAFVARWISQTAPSVVVCDSHPAKTINKTIDFALPNERTCWVWVTNSASLGSPQSRLRNIHISGRGKVDQRSQMASLYLLFVCVPQSIYDCLDPSDVSQNFLEGNLNVTSGHPTSVVGPESIGYIHLDRDRPTTGTRWSRRGTEHVVQQVSGDRIEVRVGENLSWRNLSEVKLIPANYQVFNTRGVSFPVSQRSCPSGIGHTLILDPHHCKVRALSMKECWKLQGGPLWISRVGLARLRRKTAFYLDAIGPYNFSYVVWLTGRFIICTRLMIHQP